MTDETGDRANYRIVWMDMEMTGLNPDSDQILEIATLITDSQLEIIAEGPELVLHAELVTLEAMDDWNRTHHQASGLWKSVLESQITLAEATRQTLDFVLSHTEKRKSPLAGNSIWQDRRFLCKYMPEIDAHLHYRIFDVSTFKEAIKIWKPDGVPQRDKDGKHRALDDIKESIAEMAYYKKLLNL